MRFFGGGVDHTDSVGLAGLACRDDRGCLHRLLHDAPDGHDLF